MITLWAMILAVFFWVQPVMAHDSMEEIAAKVTVERQKQVEREYQQKQRGIERKHEVLQEYVKRVNQWYVRLQIFPQSGDGMSKIRLWVRGEGNKIPNLTEASLFLMQSGQKAMLTKQPTYFTASVLLPKSSQSIMMVKMKDKHGKTYFVKFQH